MQYNGYGFWTVIKIFGIWLIIGFKNMGHSPGFRLEIFREYYPEMIRFDLLPFQIPGILALAIELTLCIPYS